VAPLDFQQAVDKLYDQNQLVVKPFFARYSELEALYNGYVASTDVVEKKRSALLANFLPELKRRRKRQQALQTVSAAAKTQANVAESILGAIAVLHAAADSKMPALEDLTAIEQAGLSARFYFRDTATDPIDHPSNAEPPLAYRTTGENRLPSNGGNPISGIWSGFLEAPESGFYNLDIETDADAKVELTLGETNVALTQKGKRWNNGAAIELRAGTLHPFVLKVEKVKETLIVQWQTTGRGWEVIPARYLYSAILHDRLSQTYIRFFKIISLAVALKFTSNETAHLAAHADYRMGGQGWLNSLPHAGNPDSATSTALFKGLNALLDFACCKARLAPDDECLLALLQKPQAAAKTPDGLLFSLTRWESSSVDALLKRFEKTTADLANIETFRRLLDAYTWVTALGVSATALIDATTNEPTAETVRDLQAALRARYAESDWLNVIKPINDEPRGLQRDALVAYILHHMRANATSAHIDTPEKLFEYFLMDVQMEPCMQTSRIRHALSSVQLFIERCLMNLEQRVGSSVLNAKHWEWMKRYRVWEANRKIFLWPENWLEPELRDDRSPFFKQTMSELLQGDITEERAAVALLNYLTKLEEVAKLEPCGTHYVESEPGTADDVAHVVARTAGASRKYFYRRREHGSWTPWEQIKLDIEDNPVIPVVWKNRLFLFWLRILKKLAPTTQKPGTAGQTLTSLKTDDIKNDPPNLTVQAMLCWSEHFNGKWQTTRTSDVNNPITLGVFSPDGFHRSELKLGAAIGDGALEVWMSIGNWRFLLYNTHSLPTSGTVSRSFDRWRTISTSGNSLTVSYHKLGTHSVVESLDRQVLKKQTC
jgi:hypothetical protein